MNLFENLIQQIDAFIRKYYKNKMIKGGFLFICIFLFSWLVVSGIEYLGQFNRFIRGFLFFSFLVLNAYVFIRYILLPLLKLYSFGKRISRYQAAQIIGQFFPDIDDKLLNTLQLHSTVDKHQKNIQFIQASIAQNSQQLSNFQFVSAIDYKENKRFLTYFFSIVFVVVLIASFVPRFYKEGTQRILNYGTVYTVAPDFTFHLLDSNLLVEEGSNYKVRVKLVPRPGKALPSSVYLVTENGRFLMKKETKNRAFFTLDNLHETQNFYFESQDNHSKSYTLKVIKRSSLGNISVQIHYPNYLQQTDKTIPNPSSLIIPEGTRLTWNGTFKNAQNLTVLLTDTAFHFSPSGFRITNTFIHSDILSFILHNKKLGKNDTTRFSVQVIPDKYPEIAVKKMKDSLDQNLLFFGGDVRDDYGLTSVVFYYKIKSKGKIKMEKSISVPGINGVSSSFNMNFDISTLPLSLNDKLIYYFVVYDNDGIHGPKATKSQIFEYTSPSFEELNKERNKEKEQIADQLKNVKKSTSNFAKRIRNFRMNLANSSSISWQQKQTAKSLEEQRKKLEKKINQLKEKLKSSFKDKNKLTSFDKEMLEKQKELQKLLDKLMDDELKDLLHKLQKKLDANQQKNLLNDLKKGEKDAQKLQRQLERSLEMLKRMDAYERTKDLQKGLQKLAHAQDSLRKEIDKGLNNQKGLEKQKELNKQFEKLKNNLDTLLKKNKDLKEPFDFKGLDSLSKEISNEMKQSSNSLKNGNQNNAGKHQKKASNKMQQMASQMNAQMRRSQQNKHKEDLRSMQQLERNLLFLSFDQEQNIKAFSKVNAFDPYYTILGRKQQDIIDNFKPIRDSLFALADRVPKISSFIEQEVEKIETNFSSLPYLIDERRIEQRSVKQRFVMTHLNTLALFIDESIQQAQKQMRMKSPGMGQSCPTPGQTGKSGKPNQMAQSLEQLKKMIRKQLESLKKGSQKGGKKPGDKPGKSGNGQLQFMNSEKASKLAAQMAKMRQMLNRMKQELNKDGSGTGNQLNPLIKKIEEQKKDLVNKKWDSELIKRQQKILTHLLQSEKSLRTRGFQKQRKSKTGKNRDFGNQIRFLEYKKKKRKQIELLKTLDPSFTPYYRRKATEYFERLNK